QEAQDGDLACLRENIGSGKGAKDGGKSQNQILRSLLPNDHRIQRQGQPKSQPKPQFKHLPGPDPSLDACRDHIETCHYADVLLHHKKANYMLLAGQGWCVWVPESRSPNVSSQLTDAQLQRVWAYLHATEEGGSETGDGEAEVRNTRADGMDGSLCQRMEVMDGATPVIVREEAGLRCMMTERNHWDIVIGTTDEIKAHSLPP
ncbi:hypothetical protein CPC16_009559, partial [Podila verticillata]